MDLASHNVLMIMIGDVLLSGIYTYKIKYFMPLVYIALYIGYMGRVGA